MTETMLSVHVYHWRCQLWGTGAPAPLDFQLFNFFWFTLEVLELWHWTLCGCLSGKNIQAYSFVTVIAWIY